MSVAELRLYNTLSGEKETFVPQRRDQVSMYVCGPTVYNYAPSAMHVRLSSSIASIAF